MLIGVATQPVGQSNLQLLASIISANGFEEIDVAAAYVTTGGARDVLSMLEASLTDSWLTARKRWLVSFDYCRTEPLALSMLLGAPASQVRVHDGATVIKQRGTPQVPFHPKTFVMRGPASQCVFAGSGNISRSGMNTGHEVGQLLGARVGTHRKVEEHTATVSRWYTDMWNQAQTLDARLFADYERLFESTPIKRAPAPTEDDVLQMPAGSRNGLDPEQLLKLRVCKHFWIEAGNISRNLGPHVPGNQLMMKRLSRVFFGVPPSHVEHNSPLRHVAITYQGHTKADCSLTFSDNGMDKLTLPIPGVEGPPKYDRKNLLFTRMGPGAFLLELGTAAAKERWVRQSKAIEASWAMQGGRKFGAF